ncbi:MAG: STAS domain-containing protein [Clostridia bacterium]|nr:STAS domain-containing protein [Clostridia bacterium]
MLNIITIENKGEVTLALEGRLDSVSAPELENKIKEITPHITDLIFDLEKLDYISSAGLRILLSAQKAMNERGGMKVRNVDPTVMEVFEITGFAEILTIE